MRLPDGQVGHFNRHTISLFAGGQSQFSPPKRSCQSCRFSEHARRFQQFLFSSFSIQHAKFTVLGYKHGGRHPKSNSDTAHGWLQVMNPKVVKFFLKCHSKTLGVWACPSILDGSLPTELRRESARNTWLMDHSAQAIEVRRLILFPSILHTWNDRNMAAGRLKTCHLA